VAAIKLDFTSQNPAVKNGYAGYCEIGMAGPASLFMPPIPVQNILPVGGSDVVGSTITFTATFTSPNPP
jgi:hypothetical protein